MMNPTVERIVERIGTVVLGKRDQARLALTCLFAGGHLLIEDLPGIGKTTLAKVLSRCLGLDFQRIQCTSDMLPGDILGVSIYDRGAGRFVFHPGPIFSQVLLVDEINRVTPKTQSALLEAMEERQVTVEGTTRPLPEPFFVIATQNPQEQAGTFPLPESQLDRFLMRISIGYPDRRAEKDLLRRGEFRNAVAGMTAALPPDGVQRIQERVAAVAAADALLDYAQDIIAFTRTSPEFSRGLSPRAGLAVLQAARAWAWMEDRDHVLPEDLQAVLGWVVGHRLHGAGGETQIAPDRLTELLMDVPIP
jgi:MoxR-like ATPase